MDRIKQAIRYFHTLRYLKPIQIYGQIKFRLHKPAFTDLAAPSIREQSGKWVLPISKNNNVTTANRVTFLNQERDISSPAIWDNNNVDKLWLYNLHYFDLLNSDANAETQLHFVKRWIAENPPKHKSNGWESYTLSLRSVNWTKWLILKINPDEIILQSLAAQVRYLSKRLEIHIQGNHLLANAKALLFAGCYFTGAEADGWFKTALKHFTRELKKQILKDGGHFELSPLYHSIILEDLLDVINLFKTYAKTIPAAWHELVNKMFFWLAAMSHPDKNIAFFNDTTLGIASPLSALSDYHQRLALPALPNTTFQSLTYLPNSGYARLQKGNAVILTDVARAGPNYQPGHAHADTLSFELSIEQQRVFVNSGISTYNDSDLRRLQRGTSAHNTLKINDSDSSEVWKSFRLARRAKVFNVKTDEQPEQVFIRACHNGYYHSYKIIHSRIWQLSKKQLLIIDDVTGKNPHKIALHFHLHPEIKTEYSSNEIKLYDIADKYLATVQSAHPLKLIESTYHPGFNRTQPNQKILIETITALPQRFETLITWN